MTKIFNFVMAGGGGTRLAPLSLDFSGKLPKQFHALIGDKSLLQHSLNRIPDSHLKGIITCDKYSDIITRQTKGDIHVIYEPMRCNTAMAIAYGVAYAISMGFGDDDIVVIKTADHYMDTACFQKYLDIAIECAKVDKIVTIGIKPEYPETGFGYLKTNKCNTGDKYCSVEEFREKPSYEVAKEYVDSENYYWNSGMFVFTLRAILRAFKAHSPLISTAIPKIVDCLNKGELGAISDIYDEVKENGANISIDYAVMEKEARNMILIPTDTDLKWNDLGSWTALERYFERNGSNAIKGKVKTNDCSECIVLDYRSNSNYRILCNNLCNLIVVNSDNGILIYPKNDGQRAKEMVPLLKEGQFIILIDSNDIDIKNTTNIPVCCINCSNLEILYDDSNLIISRI